MEAVEIFILLLALTAGLALLANRIRIPYPALLVLAGLALSLLPRRPAMELNPGLVLIFFLPPIVYQAALVTSWRDFQQNLRAILLLGVGLVIFTTLLVGCVAHALIPGLPWAAAFALGAIVSPSDTAGAIAVLQELPIPRRVVTVLEDESLINDATGLVAYKFAVVAASTGIFSFWQASAQFAWTAAGGVLIGLLVGRGVLAIHRRLDNPSVQATLSLLTPFTAFALADAAAASGVIAVAAAGVTVGWNSAETVNARARMTAVTMWEMIVFVLNGCAFILIGLQLPEVVHGLASLPRAVVWETAAAVCAAVIVGRVVWVFTASYVPRKLSAALRRRDPMPPANHIALVAWTGMRGIVSLAAAFALPFSTASGSAFPYRSLILFLTFAVIVATLVLQGFTLPLVVRALRVRAAEGAGEAEEELGWRQAAEAALARLAEIEKEGRASPAVVARLRSALQEEIVLCEEHRITSSRRKKSFLTELSHLERQLLRTQRQAIVHLRNTGSLNHETARKILRELDLYEVTLH
ncbi:MAG TPA: Na+/H+ antiporter [Opitutaceae bacterium]|nr:Na+/H+ antiporter [Opitutaceae bacterium]